MKFWINKVSLYAKICYYQSKDLMYVDHFIMFKF